MAPDLSGVTRSQRPTNTAGTSASPLYASPSLSRRTSSVMAPPPVPQNSSLPNSPRPPMIAMDSSGYGGTTGPIRHPRPLTAAELHLELEKEQESIVNRLTRELSALRAQTASVASTASSTSDLFTTNQSDSNSSHLYTYNSSSGITPTSARRHRSSSNLSSRSARSARDALAASASATSVSGVAAPRRDRDHSHSHQASSRPSIEIPRPDISRQNSMSGVYRAPSYTAAAPNNPTTTSPAAWQSHSGGQHQSSARHSISSNYSTSVGAGGGPLGESIHYTRSPSSNAIGFTNTTATRYEEAATQRQELEAVKRENEALKLRIRELERNLSTRGGQRESVHLSGVNGTSAAGMVNATDT